MTLLFRCDAGAAAIGETFGIDPGDDPWAGGHVAPQSFAPVITAGRFEMLIPDHPALMVYLRQDAQTQLLVIGSYARDAVTLPEAVVPDVQWQLLMTNVPDFSDGVIPDELPPFFAGVWVAQNEPAVIE